MIQRIVTVVRGNLIAWLALFVALSGTSVAASHYVIKSTRQINPKVLKALKGKTGARGKTGAAGATGSQGPTGTTGAKGASGTRGERGEAGVSALSTLPSGQSESGEYGAGDPGGTNGETLEESVSFPVPLEEGVPASHVAFTKVDVTVEHCSGPGHADQGFVCIYSNAETGINPKTEIIFNPEVLPTIKGATGRFGFMLAWNVSGPDARAFGTYTVTAG
jgi:hypothetical protein